MTRKTGQGLRRDLFVFVELPGIEPATKMTLTCGDAESEYAKQREKYAKTPADTRRVLMATTRRNHLPAGALHTRPTWRELLDGTEWA